MHVSSSKFFTSSLSMAFNQIFFFFLIPFHDILFDFSQIL